MNTFAAPGSGKKPGWFSRRHQGNDVHAAVSAANHERLTAKTHDAWARQAASAKLTTAQKLAKLPATGAVRERAKLTARLASEPKPKAPKGK
jgi:hypothetical protein